MIVEVMDSDAIEQGAFSFAVVAEDVLGADGKIAIPAGAPALLVVRQVGRQGGISHLTLALYQVIVGEKTYRMLAGNQDLALLALVEDSTKGAMHRSVHVERQARLEFRISTSIKLK